MKFSLIVFSLLLIQACSQKNKIETIAEKGKAIVPKLSSNKVLLLFGVEKTPELEATAQKHNVKISGDSILTLTGETKNLSGMEISSSPNSLVIVDSPVTMIPNLEIVKNDYMAKKEFGLDRVWQKNPEYDGRGVIVGVIDDGISPHIPGFLKTTTGERKLLMKENNSSLLVFKLEEPKEKFTFETAHNNPYKVATIDEKAINGSTLKLDLNADGTEQTYYIAVQKTKAGFLTCVDTNANTTFENKECSGNFSLTGEFSFWDKKKMYSFTSEVAEDFASVKISEPEISNDDHYDSHGEGVASVIAGYQMGGKVNGVAPGAKILDYELSAPTHIFEENTYTIGTFIKALDWVGKNGANVANISYSLFFHSAESQLMMKRALDYIVEKHNLVVSFSAGNNGPGITSMNRRQIYPYDSLVVAAHAPKDLEEMVWGVSGLPEEGRVIYYSSRGPDAAYGEGANVLGVLSNLIQDNNGFRAFSGTSSAAPSVGGAAAVLISALKQKGLPIVASSVVHALRLSGKQLKEAALIEQGYGHPQVDRALEIYPRLLKGELFERVNSFLSTDNGKDELSARGIFLKMSQVKSIYDTEVTLHGINSAAPVEVTAQLLKKIKIEYSSPAITGSKEMWVSRTPSTFAVQIDLTKLNPEKHEFFHEITLTDADSGELIHRIPVTIVNDRPLNQIFSFQEKVLPQEGKRYHFNLEPEIKALNISLFMLSGKLNFVGGTLYNSSGVKSGSIKRSSAQIIPVKSSGYHQLAVFKNEGIPAGTDYNLVVSPMKLKLTDNMMGGDDRVIKVKYEGEKLDATLELWPPATVYLDKNLSYKGKTVVEKIMLTEKGNYEFAVNYSEASDITFPYIDCVLTLNNKETPAFIEKKTDDAEELVINCIPFEASEVFKNFKDQLWVNLKVTKSKGSSATKSITLTPGVNKIEFDEAALKFVSGENEAFIRFQNATKVPLGPVNMN